jgi:hypothetical protein
MVEEGPCPGNTTVSSGNPITTSFTDFIIAAESPVGRSVLPMLPAKRVSPVKSQPSFLK